MTAITMTGAASARGRRTPSTLTRLVNVLRLHTANPWTTLYTPWLILLGVFGLNYSVWRSIVTASGGVNKLDTATLGDNGGVTWIAVFVLVLAIQAMNITFRFALGYSVTRRDYYVGTVVYYSLLSAMYGTGIALLAGIERATGGWGMHAAFFAPAPLDRAPLWEVGYVFTLLILIMFGVGIAFGTVFVRWRATGMVVFVSAIATAGVATAIVVMQTHSWGAIGRFFTDKSVAEIMPWGLIPTAISVGLGFVIMRRATPRA